MSKEELRQGLARKLAILEKIAANTAAQSRFICKREMRGLRRLLRERAALIDEFAAVTGRLAGDEDWPANSRLFAAEVRAIDAKQRQVLGACDRVLQQALAERARILAEINNRRMMHKAKTNYVNRWTTMAFGNRLNVKG